MRLTALFLLACLCYGSLGAQDIVGRVVDTTGQPIPFATVTLKKTKDSTLAKISACDSAGQYRFIAIPVGQYYLTVGAVGFLATSTASFDLKDSIMRIAPVIAKVRGTLNEAHVTGVKPLLQVQRDRLIVNVEGNINATGEDALSLLRKSPGITVDNNSSLSLGGKSGVQVYVDGRPTYLTGAGLAQYLSALPSSSIESIEIISNPSARYEAAGSAGIVNIRLKKDKSLGTNYTAGVGYNLGTYSKYNATFSFNHRDKQLNFFGDYAWHQGTALYKSIENRTIPDTLFLQQDVMTVRRTSHTFHLGLDYFIDKNNTLGILVGSTLTTDSVRTYSRTPIIYTPANTTSRLLIAGNQTSDLEDTYSASLNYHHTGKEGRELDVNADYGLYRIRKDQLQPNNYYDSTGTHFKYGDAYNLLSPTDIHIYSIKADYSVNVWKGQLAVGAKLSFVNSANNFQQYDVISAGKVLDSMNSDNFIYKENINAFYFSFNRAFKNGLTLQAGLRAENTNGKGSSTGWQPAATGFSSFDSLYPRHYTDLFPSASLSYKNWTASYSRRIDRPDYQDLNPFVLKLDDYIYLQGNTQLQPQYANNLSLTWSWNTFSATASYSHISDLFTTIPDTIDRSKTVNTEINLASQEITGLNVSYSFRYKWYSAFINVNGFYAVHKANFGPGKVIDLNIFNTSIVSQHNFQLGKGWSASLSQMYTSPNIWQGTLKAHSLWSLDAGFQKSFFHGRATAKASVSDIFYTLGWAATSNFAGQYIYSAGTSETRQGKLSLSWRFGGSQVKAARQHETGAEDEANRVKAPTP